ncbi:MAG: phage terminase large subunit [Gammaproteobacteria bacterium]|nr:phage terminase large subunit [Gammaproteobacteria bacterium]
MAKLSSREFARQLADLAAGFRREIEAQVTGFDPDPAASRRRRERAHGDLEFFARTYFPHYATKPNSRLHDYLYRRLVEIADSPRSETDAIAAPRGEAKSTITSQIFVIWCVVTGRKWYPMIGMDAFDQAAIMLEAIKAELEANPRLLMDYPEAAGPGRVWKAGVILTRNDRKIEAVGSGKRIRGRRHGPHRPDLFIGDDLENDENVRTPEQRDKLQAWLTKAVLKLGGAGAKFDTVVIGTILHYDSMLSRLLANPLWRTARFQALIRWPDNMELWDRWEERLLHEGMESAAAFYAAHEQEMNAGAEVSWPAGRPLVDLMTIRARDGHAAFDSELQNDPLSDDDAPFAKAIHFWVDRLREWVFYGACDPSLGKHGANRDPSAIVVGGFNRETGVLDVVEAAIRKRLPDRIIEDIIGYQLEYMCLVWGVEAVQFQEFLRAELVKRSAKRGIPVPAVPLTPHADKTLRIESLQPHMANRLIRLHTSQSTLITQLRHFPKADHDDGPDALQMLWVIATSFAGGIPRPKAPQRRRDARLSLVGY